MRVGRDIYNYIGERKSLLTLVLPFRRRRSPSREQKKLDGFITDRKKKKKKLPAKKRRQRERGDREGRTRTHIEGEALGDPGKRDRRAACAFKPLER